MLVRNHMTRDPICMDPSAPVRDILRAMALRKVHHMPIADDRRHALGIISATDLCRAAGVYESDLAERRADEVMSRPRSIAMDAPLRWALDQLCEHGADALLVVDRGILIGTLTRADVLRALRSALAFDQEGSCLEVSLDDPDDLFVVFQVLQEQKAEVRSAVIGAVREDGGGAVLGLRVGVRDPRPLERALTEAALTLLVPQEELALRGAPPLEREPEPQRES
ncbi:MAG: CBS domain-containing protein [Phycisphaerales bacterium]|nr:CBS domain-containing protein [Phycisphaerales bacterium]